MIPRLSFLGLHYIVLHIKMHIFTYESARIHTSYTESLASCSYNIRNIHMAMSQNCVWNVPRCSGRMERRGFVTGLVPDVWNVMKYKLYIKINMYTVYMYNTLYIIYISRICTLKLLPLAAAHFHFSSARHPCCTPVQRRFALHG